MTNLHSGILFDSRGNIIPPGEDRKRAEDKLKNFIEKHKAEFEGWFREHGATTKPPIKYDLSKQEWFWVD